MSIYRAFFALLFGSMVPSPLDAQERPNIVLFLVDDLGWQDTSVPFHSSRTPFNDRYRTETWSGWQPRVWF